jgi:peptidoglycan hydrolase FlgJ
MTDIRQLSGTAPLKPVDQAVAKAAQGFEAIVLRQMLGAMRQARLAEDLFGSSATDNFRELADARTADAMAKLGQFGIAQMVERQISASKVGK